MPDILSVIAPIFLLVGLGWWSVRGGHFPAGGLPVLAQFVVRFALPALVFRSLATRQVAEVLNAPFLVAYTLGSLAAAGAALAWAHWARRDGLEASALLAMGVSCSNSAFIGFPVCYQLVGPEAGIGLALCMMVENLLLIPLCLALADTGSAAHEPFGQAFRRALAGLPKNPLILAIAAGFLFSLFQLPLPAPVFKAVDLLANASAAAALFFIGGTLVGLSARETVGDVVPVAFGKLVLHPAAVLIALWLVGPISPALHTMAVVMAAAPMLGIYPIFGQRHGLGALCSARMVGTTLASFATLGLWIAVMAHPLSS